MRNLSLVLFAGLLVGCTTVLKVGDKLERAVTPPDAVNFYTTQADGSFKSVINDSRIARKVEVTAMRKSKSNNGFNQFQFDLRSESYLAHTIKVSCEFLGADGAVVEKQDGWTNLPFQPGAMQTFTAMALDPKSVECRMKLMDK
jgi:outer membrane PBP1 activator LpoA protein